MCRSTSTSQPRAAFPYAFNSGADFILVGMFDWQIEEDTKLARRVVAAVTSPDTSQTSPRRWVMLTLGTTAQAIASSLLFGLPFLLPYLLRTEGLTLAQGGALVAAPSLGLVATLIAWAILPNRFRFQALGAVTRLVGHTARSRRAGGVAVGTA